MKSRRIIKWSMKNLVNTIHRTLDNKFDFFLVIEGKRGLGKTQKKGSKVLMSDGSWKNIEDIKINDEVVSPQKNGKISFEKVTETHNRFEEDMYDVIEKNRQNNVLYTVAGNHDLVISTRKWKELPKENGKRKRKKERIIKEIEARDLAKQKLLKSGNSTICSFSTTPVKFKNQKDPEIDAYSLGVFLGDGSFTCSLNITTPDLEIINKVSKKYPIMSKYNKAKSPDCFSYRFSILGEFGKQLTELGLKEKRSGTKFIPEICKKASLKYRMELLAGLIDTDGYLMKKSDNHISITTKSQRLAEDIRDIVFSLGGYSNIRKIEKKCQNNYIGKYFCVKISFENPQELPLVCEKKKKRLGNKKTNDPRMVAIDLKKAEPDWVYGFSITGKSKWYVTDNWMITHNSTMAVHLARAISREFKKQGRGDYRFKWNTSLLYTKKETKNYLHKWKAVGIADELINVTFNRDFYNEEQKDIIKMINMNRDHCNFFIACVPSFQTLDSQIKNLCKMRLTVVRRGMAIIQTPNKIIYCRDQWDQATNEKIEREWLQKGIKNPQYARLTTFRGIVKFPPLTEKQELKYQKVKDDKRNIIAKEDMKINEEEEKNPVVIAMSLLQKGEIKNSSMIDGMAYAHGFTPQAFKSRISEKLKKEGVEHRLTQYYWEKKYKKKSQQQLNQEREKKYDEETEQILTNLKAKMGG